jgi:hypothetical protein
MKYQHIILSLLLLVVTITSWGQSNCPPNGISTNPENPINPIAIPNSPCEDVLNYFDWRVQSFSTPYFNNNGTNLVESPFYNDENSFLQYIAWHTQYGGPNYHPEDGWELLRENITETSGGVDFIYFILYNKFSSTIRVFGAFEQKNQDYNYYVIRLEFPDGSQNMTALLHPTGGLAQPLDKESIGLVHTTFSNPLDESRFVMADFPVEYDPCTCLKDNDGLSVYFNLVEEQQLQLYGRLWALSGTVGDIMGGVGNFDQNDFLTSVHSANGYSQAGTMIYNSLQGLITKYEANAAADSKMDKQLKALKATKILLDFVAKTAGKIPTPEAQIAALAANTIGAFVGYASYKVEEKQGNVQAQNEAIGSITVTQAEMAFSGSIAQVQNSGISFNMDLPGSPTNNQNCEAATYPKYNEVLGRIAVLETPKVEIGEAFNFAAERSKSYRLNFDGSSFKYLLNPAVGVNENNTLIYAGLVLKVRNSTPQITTIGDGYNLNFASENAAKDSLTYVSQFVNVNCLSDLTVQLDCFPDVEFLNVANPIEIYDVQLRLIIYYEFNQLNINGKPNKAFQILTYPLNKVNKTYEDILTPLTNDNNEPIRDSLYIGTNFNFTASQTIFAWRKVVINADLTTNPNINIEIIAPEIVVQGGSIGQGIELKQGYFPISCAPLNQYNGSLTSFCGGETYKGNQQKNARLIADTQIKEKPQTAVAFRTTPNPFTNTFNLEFELEEGGETSLIVYDALGRVVETVIVNDNLSIGKHQYQIDGTKLGSGIYYVKLNHSNGSQTIKIIKQ